MAFYSDRTQGWYGVRHHRTYGLAVYFGRFCWWFNLSHGFRTAHLMA